MAQSIIYVVLLHSATTDDDEWDKSKVRAGQGTGKVAVKVLGIIKFGLSISLYTCYWYCYVTDFLIAMVLSS